MKVARVKNGFLDKAVGGYRDIKINVIFESETENLNMICEVQLILNQYLFEKKKMHKLYSVIRDEVYYDMVVKEENDIVLNPEMFEPILNVKEDVESDVNLNELSLNRLMKCAVNSE